MKILLISNLYEPYSKGGAERVAQTIAEEMVSQGHSVRVLTTKPAFTGKKEEAIHGVAVERYYPPNLCWYGNLFRLPACIRVFWHLKDMLQPYNYWKVQKVLRRFQPDIVVTHNLKGIGYLTSIAVRKSGVRYIHTVHDVQLAIPSGLLLYGQEQSWQQRIFLRSWYERLTKKLFDSPDAVIFPSKFLQDFYDERGFFPQSKKIILLNPVSVTTAQQQKKRKDTILRIVYVGQIEPHKGIAWFARVFMHWCAKNTHYAQLTIVGGGSELVALQKIYQHSTQVRVEGHSTHSRALKTIAESDVLVVPSLCYENTPTVIYEAHAAGIPVLASRIGGIPEIVDEKAGDMLFTPKDENEVCFALDYYTHQQPIYSVALQSNDVQKYVRQLMMLIADNVKL